MAASRTNRRAEQRRRQPCHSWELRTGLRREDCTGTEASPRVRAQWDPGSSDLAQTCSALRSVATSPGGEGPLLGRRACYALFLWPTAAHRSLVDITSNLRDDRNSALNGATSGLGDPHGPELAG